MKTAENRKYTNYSDIVVLMDNGSDHNDPW